MPDPSKKIMVKIGTRKEPKSETNTATRQDSIVLKEDSLRLLKDYQDKGYIPTDKKFPDRDNEKSLKEIKERTSDTQVIRKGIRNPEKVKVEDYRTDIDKNKYTQREAANGVLNMDIKPALYDKRIKPTSSIKLMGQDGGTYNDGVNIPYYGDMEISKEKKDKPESVSTQKTETKKKESLEVKTPEPKPTPKKVLVKKPTNKEYTETSQTLKDSIRVGTSFVKVDPKITKKAEETIKELKK